MRDAFVNRLMLLAEANPRILLISGDLGFGVLTRFAERFPKQYLNAGVAEQNMTGLATGLALEGRTVFTYSIANFPTLRCLEQIRNDACYHGANVKIVAVGGGFSYGALGISHHATEDLAILRALPEITVVSPCDTWEAAEATGAIAGTAGVCYLRLDKTSALSLKEDKEGFVLGRARRWREGADMTIIATGGILKEVLEAADILAQGELRCSVLGMHTIKPIDRQAILEAGLQTGGIVTVEEHTVDGGLGSAVAEVCMDAGVHPRRFVRLGLRSGFSSIVGAQEYLRKCYGLDSASIAMAVQRLLHERPQASEGPDVDGGGADK
jgi:transketolase